jgi:hypothetical protein
MMGGGKTALAGFPESAADQAIIAEQGAHSLGGGVIVAGR